LRLGSGVCLRGIVGITDNNNRGAWSGGRFHG
jgi:hypothetical protein